VAGLFFLREKPKIPATLPPTTTAKAGGLKLSFATDPALVFKKAFWRQPSSEDKILHAERREWSADDGVRKWQWFIIVTPGPQLVEWLATNPFSLASTSSPAAIHNPPTWFPKPTTDFQIHQNPEGHFILMFSRDGKHLYATDSGHGFTPPDVTP
jgi:hypothetical protein